MHRAERADWEKQPPGDWNSWQRLAARSGGIATPANLISLIGALTVFLGLYLLTIEYLVAGALLVLLGRAADIADGMVADYTKTKSPLGEAVDATIDKIVIFVSLIVLWQQSLVPGFALIIVLLPSIYVSLLSLYARSKRYVLHPSLAGKLSTAFGWIALAVYVLEGAPQNKLLTWLAGTLLLIFLVGSLIACVEYTKQVYRLKS